MSVEELSGGEVFGGNWSVMENVCRIIQCLDSMQNNKSTYSGCDYVALWLRHRHTQGQKAFDRLYCIAQPAEIKNHLTKT